MREFSKRSMRRAAVLGIVLLMLGITTEIAHAQCAFQRPNDPLVSHTGRVDTRLVQAYVACGSCTLCGEISNPPNIAALAGVPACSSPQTENQLAGNPVNGWLWGSSPTSWGRVRLTRAPSLSCPVKDVRVQLWLRHVVDATGPATGTGTLNLMVRATFNNPPDVTMVDFPVAIAFPLAAGNTTFQSYLGPAFALLGQPCLPQTCTNLEVLTIEVIDENGNKFARPGIELL